MELAYNYDINASEQNSRPKKKKRKQHNVSLSEDRDVRDATMRPTADYHKQYYQEPNSFNYAPSSSNCNPGYNSFAEDQSDTAERNNRLLALGGVTGIHDDLLPIIDYAQEPLLPLAEACAPLRDILHDLDFYVQLALNETPETPPDQLTIDESAAIRLYTIEWQPPHRSLYSMLNYTLKNRPREQLQPYHKYMKLFLTALVKLPFVPPATVWRGVTKDLSAEFPRGTRVTWWAFSSCTTELTVLENKMYLGDSGERTLFSVEVFNGRTVRAHSHFVTEDEILLLPGTHMEVQSIFRPAADMHIVHLKQMQPTETLLEPPFEGAQLYPPEPKVVPWYKRKRTIVELSIIVALAIAGIIAGAVIASRKPPAPPICYPRTFSIRADYLWSFSCSDAREDRTGRYNGTLINGASFFSPDFAGQDKALQLDRKLNQYVLLPRSLNLTLNTSFTVSSWIYVVGYKNKTILTDCNSLQYICIILFTTENSLNVQIVDWKKQSLVQEVFAYVNRFIGQTMWVYTTFIFDRSTSQVSLYVDEILVEEAFLNLSFPISTISQTSPGSAIGLNTVTKNAPFYGLIDQLSVSYFAKNFLEIQFEVTTTFAYNFDTDDINRGTGPNSIPARSQHVYRSVTRSNNESTLFFNTTDSYFQSTGFTLLSSSNCDFTISLWFRLDLNRADLDSKATTVLQFTSLLAGHSSRSYDCLFSMHIYPHSHVIGFFFPTFYTKIPLNNSFVQNNVWTHFAVVYDGEGTFNFYQNSVLIHSSDDSDFWTLIPDKARFSLTVGGAYLDDEMVNKPDNFESMNCFARIPAFNYTQMYGHIDELRLFARGLSAIDIAQLASTKNTAKSDVH